MTDNQTESWSLFLPDFVVQVIVGCRHVVLPRYHQVGKFIHTHLTLLFLEIMFILSHQILHLQYSTCVRDALSRFLHQNNYIYC